MLTDRLTRIVATIGPASVDLVPALVAAGMDVARVNLSHGSADDHRRAVAAVRRAARDAGRPIGLLIDLPGPKLRLAPIPGGSRSLREGEELVLVAGSDRSIAGGALTLGDARILPVLRTGDRVLLADGAAELCILEAHARAVRAQVVRGGEVRSRAGISIPAERLDGPWLSEADRALLPLVHELMPDAVGQSFVRGPADVLALRADLPGTCRIIAKIETRPAVDAIAGILDVADGIMVARGDLGVELPFEQVPIVQKALIRAALAAGRPSIVATQMLESMTQSARPTRAEASDVANAVLDGADAVMLSGETAIGEHPVQAVAAMDRICRAAEGHERSTPGSPAPPLTARTEDAAAALARAAVALANADAQVHAIAAWTATGRTAYLLARLRPDVPILAFTPDGGTASWLTLHRGLVPAVVDGPDPAADPDRLATLVRAAAQDRGWPAGWEAVLVATSPQGGPNRVEVVGA
jgi:pyruvate kinase